jgi:hypothetical protein
LGGRVGAIGVSRIQFSSRRGNGGRSSVLFRSTASTMRSLGERGLEIGKLDHERARGALKIVGLLGANFGDDVRKQLAMKLALGCDSPPRSEKARFIGRPRMAQVIDDKVP